MNEHRGHESGGQRERTWPLVDVVLLGWRACDKTIGALRGLASCGYPSLRVIVVDNGSDDGADVAVWEELKRLRPGSRRIEASDASRALDHADRHDDGGWVFIRSERNCGYARGMNLGLAHLEANGPGDYFLLVNNDVLIGPGCIEALVERCEEDPTIGLCGPTQVVCDDTGAEVSTVPCGFRYWPALGFSAQIRFDPTDADVLRRVETSMYAIQGGAVLGTAAYRQAVRRLNTDSFLYFEEQDIAHMARKAGFRVAWAPRALVRNVQTETMLTNGIPPRSRLPMVRYLMARARIRFTMRHHPYFLPSVLCCQALHCAYDLCRGNLAETWAAMLAVFDALRGRHRRFPGLGSAELPGRPTGRCRVAADRPATSAPLSHGTSSASRPPSTDVHGCATMAHSAEAARTRPAPRYAGRVGDASAGMTARADGGRDRSVL